MFCRCLFLRGMAVPVAAVLCRRNGSRVENCEWCYCSWGQNEQMLLFMFRCSQVLVLLDLHTLGLNRHIQSGCFFLSLVILLQLMPVFGVKWRGRESFLEVEADTKGISWQYSPCNSCAGLWVQHPTARNKDQGLESGQQQHWRQTARLARLPSCLPAQELDGVVGIVRSFRPTHLGMANRREVDDRQQVPRKQDWWLLLRESTR